MLINEDESRKLRNEMLRDSLQGIISVGLGSIPGKKSSLSRTDPLWYHLTFYTTATECCFLGG
jgi:hypothetical protein